MNKTTPIFAEQIEQIPADQQITRRIRIEQIREGQWIMTGRHSAYVQEVWTGSHGVDLVLDGRVESFPVGYITHRLEVAA